MVLLLDVLGPAVAVVMMPPPGTLPLMLYGPISPALDWGKYYNTWY